MFLIYFANILVPTWKILNLICEGLTHWSLMENICLFSLRLWVYYMTLEVLIWHSNHNLPTDSIKNLIIWPHIQLWSSALARHEQKMLYMQIVMQFSFVCFVFSASAADILRLKSYTQQQWNNTQFFLLYSYTCSDWRLTRFLNITKQNLSEKKMPGFAHIETQCKHQRQNGKKGNHSISYTGNCRSVLGCEELRHKAEQPINNLYCDEWDRWWDRWTGRKTERQVCWQHSRQRVCVKTEKVKGARYDEKVSPPHQNVHRQDAGKNAWKEKRYKFDFCTLSF